MKKTKAEKRKPLEFAGFFSGIGGLELGFSRSGHSTRLMCEIDLSAQSVLKKHFSNHTLVNDVREIKKLPPSVNAVCAGFPCQDLSSVGNKVGITGSRSSLVHEVFRILKNNPVEWVIIENVKFMLHLNKGDAIMQIVTSLEKLGYNWCYRVVDSQAFGVPHRRQRVFFVASLNNDPRDVLLSQDIGPDAVLNRDPKNKPIGFYWTEGAYAVGMAVDGIPPLKGGSTIGIPSPPAILFPNGNVGTPDIRDAERFQGFPIDWTLPVEEVSRPSVRWRMVGNAVTVNVAEWVGEKLVAPIKYDGSGDTLIKGDKWPNAAWSMGKGRYQANCSDYPIFKPNPGLIEFLQYPTKPLSARATNGFLDRAKKGSLTYVPGFLSSLRKHRDAIQKKEVITHHV